MIRGHSSKMHLQYEAGLCWMPLKIRTYVGAFLMTDCLVNLNQEQLSFCLSLAVWLCKLLNLSDSEVLEAALKREVIVSMLFQLCV